jgi:hypothetical protein
MATYLQVRAGNLQLLIDALGVHEILSLSDLPVGGQGEHVEWRKQVLNSVPVHSFFAQEQGERVMGVVYSATEGDTPMMFEVDEIIGLRSIGQKDWLPMPRLPSETMVFFDALVKDLKTDIQVYRLKRPLQASLFRSDLITPDQVTEIYKAA